MRSASRLLASVKPARFLEPGNPTGLTGLYTHAAPRSTLLYLYNLTLDKLKNFPEHSVYRQSVERITQHRLNIVESIKPNGYDEWAERATDMVQENPAIFHSSTPWPHHLVSHGGQRFVVTQQKAEEDDRYLEWDGEDQRGQGDNGEDQPLPWFEPVEDGEHGEQHASGGTSRDVKPAEEQATPNFPDLREPLIDPNAIEWEPEPQLEASQIEEMENQIGAGLIEEVIQVAEGELKLVDSLMESKVWEELEEKPAEGQWEYFSLDRFMPTTQESPK